MAMATTPCWRKAIENALFAHSKSVVIQLASIDPNSPIPHVRSHIFRSFLTSKKNPESERLPLILTTTDIRTPKVKQIIENSHVEIAWWIEGTQEQFRISGIASVIPARDHPLYKYFEDAIKVAEPSSGLRKIVGENGTDFDWEEKRGEVFATMSPYAKAGWCRPAPGSLLTGGEEEAKKWPVRVEKPGDEKSEDGKEVSEEEKAKNKKNWETALGNFAVMIVDPTEVDYVEVGVFPNRRTKFWRNERGFWEESPLVP
ncbi:hypothetical protein E1B28_001802 [Marasmius oreades]|uniref:Pyridoxamine 5'-phosphate oxidase Alr4036 family FMN-binding domain-containing protein n=1 Tax=Marasmius oreades TaxID=181124 RepID=A0A9P7V447_9AGAR|nr:uncharacterized protein E1B28_001802 [Marasmius oreades]KAG7100015.1 hypothetical protein E1B28_001802 [Marasmius oreades]